MQMWISIKLLQIEGTIYKNIQCSVYYCNKAAVVLLDK